jgi:hypothetical protein
MIEPAWPHLSERRLSEEPKSWEDVEGWHEADEDKPDTERPINQPPNQVRSQCNTQRRGRGTKTSNIVKATSKKIRKSVKQPTVKQLKDGSTVSMAVCPQLAERLEKSLQELQNEWQIRY